MTLAYEDVKSKLVVVFSVGDVDDSLVEIFLDFGHDIKAQELSRF